VVESPGAFAFRYRSRVDERAGQERIDLVLIGVSLQNDVVGGLLTAFRDRTN